MVRSPPTRPSFGFPSYPCAPCVAHFLAQPACIARNFPPCRLVVKAKSVPTSTHSARNVSNAPPVRCSRPLRRPITSQPNYSSPCVTHARELNGQTLLACLSALSRSHLRDPHGDGGLQVHARHVRRGGEPQRGEPVRFRGPYLGTVLHEARRRPAEGEKGEERAAAAAPAPGCDRGPR